MIKAVRAAKEITVTVVNEIGVLADMAKILADAEINIEAVAGYAQGKEAKIMLVTQDSLRASSALKKSGYKSLEETEAIVIELENKVGALENVTAKLAAENVDIKQVYGTTCSAGCPAKLVVSTSDNRKAVVALKK